MSNSYQHISATRNQDVVVVTIELQRVTEYDVAEAMGKELITAFQHEPATGVVVDMRTLEYMSSVGYGPLVSYRSRVKEAGGRLVLCNLSDVLKEMFIATRLLINPQSPKSLFEHAETLEGALAMLSDEP